MPSSEPTRRPELDAIETARVWLEREAEIEAGSLPTEIELLSGHCPQSGSWRHDATTWARSILAHQEITDPAVREALTLLASALKIGVVRQAITAIEASDTTAIDCLLHAEDRLRIYAASMGEIDATWLRWQLRMGASNPARYDMTVSLLGMTWHSDFNAFRGGRAAVPGQWHAVGLEQIRSISEDLIERDDALSYVREHGVPPELPDELDDHLASVAEDRTEFRGGALASLREGLRPTAVVVPLAPERLTGARKDTWKSFEAIAGAKLPLLERGDVGAHMIALRIEFPHLQAEIATILRDLLATEVVRLRPTLLVGAPGSGKTSLARAIASVVGLPSTVYACGGQSDSSMMGTSAQWSNSRPSVPLDVVRTSRVANPLIVLDEIDKCDPGRQNGSLVDALLAFLEPSTARRHRDLSLEAEVDLSHISWIATANELRDVPGPLRDRFRIIEIPKPTWEHVGDLSRSILEELARERGLDPRWFKDLARDELDVVRKSWPGGSLRRLRRALEVLVDGRDAIMGRA